MLAADGHMMAVPGPWWVWALGALIGLAVLYRSAPQVAGIALIIIVMASLVALKQKGVV